MNHFNGQRLTALRELNNLSQTQMAASLGVTQSALSQVEKAERPLSAELAHRAAHTYQVPIDFFTVLPTPLETGVATFRKSSKAKITQERRIVRLYREAARVFVLVSEVSKYRPADVTGELAELSDIDHAAATLRQLAGLTPEEPIKNMVRFLERLGIGVVTTLDPTPTDEAAHHTGISIPHPTIMRPLIALPTTPRGDVARFTLAHELAHLIWDTHLTTPTTSTRSPEEQRAHTFAGALLLPTHVLRERVTETLNLNGYLPIKAEYGISVSAIITAAKKATIITPQRARSLYIQLSSRNWREAEPVSVPTEKPLLFAQALKRTLTITKATPEQLTGLPTETLQHWTHTQLTSTPQQPIQLSQWRAKKHSH